MAGDETVSSPIGHSRWLIDVEQILLVALGKSGAADRTLEEDVADDREFRFGMVEDDVAGGMAGAVADIEGKFADRHLVAVDQPAVGLERLARNAVVAAVLLQPGIQNRSASCGPSIWTPSSSANMPAEPQWSMWPWVSRIFSIVTPARRDGFAQLGEVAAGVDECAAHRLGAPDEAAVLLQRRDRQDGGAKGRFGHGGELGSGG